MTRDEASGINSAANFRVEASPVQSGQTPGRWVVSDHGCAVRGDAQAGLWLEGGDVVLSEMRLRTAAPCDEDGNGTNDTSQFERRLHLTRCFPREHPPYRSTISGHSTANFRVEASPASYAFSVSEGAPVDYAVDTVAASHYHRWTD